MSHAGRTPLHEACQGGHLQVMQLLMDYSRELDVQDRDGQTAAHLAAYNGEVKCLQSLADRGKLLLLLFYLAPNDIPTAYIFCPLRIYLCYE